MNRIAFQLFKKWGSNLMFRKFIEALTTLQEGPYVERLELWFSLMNEHEEKVKNDAELRRLTTSADINLDTTYVTKQKFANVVRASFPQDSSPSHLSFEEIVNRIFGAD